MSRNPNRDQYIKDMRREKIISCALSLFAKNGLTQTKIADIAATARISHGLMYHYFRSKEELYTELIRNAFDKLNAACRDLEKNPAPPREKIIMALEALVNGLSEHADTAQYHMLIAQASMSDATPNEAKNIIMKSRSIPYEVFTRIFREGQSDGSIVEQDPAVLAMAFWSTIKGLALHKTVFGDAYIAPDISIISRMFVKSV